MAESFSFKDTVAARIGKDFPAGQLDFKSFIAVIGSVLDDGQVTQEDFPDVAQYCEELYESHVRDYDIPGIPNIIEGYVDDILAKSIRPALQLLFDRLK